MAFLCEWLRRVWGSLYGGRSDRDLEQEPRFHVESVADEARRRDDGAGAGDRIRQSRLHGGGIAQSIELMRDQQGWPWLDDAKRDLRTSRESAACQSTASRVEDETWRW
jgi:hypothetical protein